MSCATVVTHAALGVGLHDVGAGELIAGTGAPVVTALRERGCTATAVDESASWTVHGNAALTGAAIVATPVILERFSAAGTTTIIPFKSSATLERTAAQHGWKIAMAPARACRQIENKLSLSDIADAAGVRVPRQLTINLARPDDIDVGVLGPGPWVLQPAMAFAGAGTELIDSITQLVQRVDDGNVRGATVAKLAEYIYGTAVTVNAVVVDERRVLVGPVASQLTGIRACTGAPFGSCGNDWTLPIDTAAYDATRDTARSIGAELGRRGFRGIFGVDVILTDAGEAILIEINPRLTASLGLQRQLLRADGAHDLVDAHLWATTGTPGAEPPWLGACIDRFSPAMPQHSWSASSVVCFHVGAVPVVPALLPPCKVVAGPDGDIEFGESAVLFSELEPGEALVLAQSPSREVRPGAELFRLVIAGSAALPGDVRALTPHARRMVQHVRDRLVGTSVLGGPL